MFIVCRFTMTANGLQLPEGRDFYRKTSFGELNFRLAQMCLRSTKPRLLGRCCYKLVFFLSWSVYPLFTVSWCVGLATLLAFFVWLCALAKNTNVPPNALAYSAVKKSAISSACFKTVSIAFACLSGG